MTVDETIRQQNNFCNITEWHENGITGKGVSIWNCENLSSHGQTSTRRVYDAAPNAEVLNAGISCVRNNEEIKYIYADATDGNKWDVDEWIKTNNIKILTRSMAGGFARDSSGVYYDYWKNRQKKYNLVINNSAGNDGESARSYDSGSDLSILVGAVNLVKGKVKPATYSSVNDDVDFSTFTGVWSGTSFSCPYLAGICALLVERYGDISQEEIYKYFQLCSVDLEKKGADSKTGYGIPILPKFEKNYITMTTKSNTYKVNGNEYKMDTKPVNKSSRVFVPIRVIAEALGGIVDWSKNKDKSIKVLINKGDTHIELNTGSSIALVNGNEIVLDVAPYIDENNRTLVPIRFIAEAFGCKVEWIQSEAKVMILEM